VVIEHVEDRASLSDCERDVGLAVARVLAALK
jgi:hypothetical protein